MTSTACLEFAATNHSAGANVGSTTSRVRTPDVSNDEIWPTMSAGPATVWSTSMTASTGSRPWVVVPTMEPPAAGRLESLLACVVRRVRGRTVWPGRPNLPWRSLVRRVRLSGVDGVELHGVGMAYLVEVPVSGGGHVRVQASADDLPAGLELASLRPGEIAARAGETLEQALEEVKPAIRGVLDWMMSLGTDEVTVDFGLALGAETGVVITKGTAEIHFSVGLTWKRPQPTALPGVDG
jgi:hypothetical protein